VGPRAGLEVVEKRKFLILPRLELRPLGRPARSQSVYRLSYPGFLHIYIHISATLLIIIIIIIIIKNLLSKILKLSKSEQYRQLSASDVRNIPLTYRPIDHRG
jgi:hypothetical protein